MTASCRFVDDDTLFMNWHNCLLIQTFQRTGPNEVVLKMSDANADGGHDLVLEVVLTRR